MSSKTKSPSIPNMFSLDIKQEYDTLISTIPDGLVLIKDGLIKYANSVFLKLLGFDVKEISDLDHLKIIHPDDLPKVFERIERRKNGELIRNEFELNLFHIDGI